MVRRRLPYSAPELYAICRRNLCPPSSSLFSIASTLFRRNVTFSTPFPSITSALFPMQRRGESISSDSVARHSTLTPSHRLLFSITYNSGNLQPLCFDNLATVPGGSGGYQVCGVNVLLELTIPAGQAVGAVAAGFGAGTGHLSLNRGIDLTETNLRYHLALGQSCCRTFDSAGRAADVTSRARRVQ